jgi:hypothetical protein
MFTNRSISTLTFESDKFENMIELMKMEKNSFQQCVSLIWQVNVDWVFYI